MDQEEQGNVELFEMKWIEIKVLIRYRDVEKGKGATSGSNR